MQAGVIEEIVNDAVDNALDSEDIEEETEEEIDKVLTAIAGETSAQLPEAIRKEKLKQPVQSVEDSEVHPNLTYTYMHMGWFHSFFCSFFFLSLNFVNVKL